MEDLEQFREQWKAEVASKTKPGAAAGGSRGNSSKDEPGSSAPPDSLSRSRLEIVEATKSEFRDDTSDDPKTALQVYENAVQKEKDGNLPEALILYRQAFKADDRVDRHYRKKYFSQPVQKPVPSRKTAEQAERFPLPVARQGHEDGSIEYLSKSVDALEIVRGDELAPSPISALPTEVLHVILQQLLLLPDLRHLVQLSYTCKKLYVLAHSSQPLWSLVCHTVYSAMQYEDESLDGEELLERWQGNWRTMFLERPRLHFDGIYISSCWYCRPGVAETWNTPVHMVTYYRYIRFYPDGTCLTLLSNTEPAEIVPLFFHWTTKPKLAKGTWKMSVDGHVSIQAEAPVPKYIFRLELQIKSSSRGRHNKLVWKTFTSINVLTDDVMNFNLRSEKNFVFSPVKSFSREIYEIKTEDASDEIDEL